MFPPPAHPAHPPILKGLKGPHHPPEEGGGCCPCSAPQQQRGHVGFGRGHVGFGRGQGHGPPRGGFQFRLFLSHQKIRVEKLYRKKLREIVFIKISQFFRHFSI